MHKLNKITHGEREEEIGNLIGKSIKQAKFQFEF